MSIRYSLPWLRGCVLCAFLTTLPAFGRSSAETIRNFLETAPGSSKFEYTGKTNDGASRCDFQLALEHDDRVFRLDGKTGTSAPKISAYLDGSLAGGKRMMVCSVVKSDDGRVLTIAMSNTRYRACAVIGAAYVVTVTKDTRGRVNGIVYKNRNTSDGFVNCEVQELHARADELNERSVGGRVNSKGDKVVHGEVLSHEPKGDSQ